MPMKSSEIHENSKITENWIKNSFYKFREKIMEIRENLYSFEIIYISFLGKIYWIGR